MSNITEERLRAEGTPLSERELEHVAQRARLRAPAIYEIVLREGEEELTRPIASLWWSGLAAGLSIGFSLVAQGLLEAHLPEAGWKPVVTKLGYSAGFLLVILGRQQLFTENTVTAVLPAIQERSRANTLHLGRLWGVVLLANMTGAFLFAGALASNLFFPPDVSEAFRAVARHFMALDASQMFLRGIVAGWLIASLVWLMPSARSNAFLVIVFATYLIALSESAHIVAGAVEAFLLLIAGETGFAKTFAGFFIPTLLGNVVGGSALFALLAHAQVREEV